MRVSMITTLVALCSYSVNAQSRVTTSAAAAGQTPIVSPCRSISSAIASYSANNPQATQPLLLKPSYATQCLESVPLNVTRSTAFIEYIRPYIQFQSTISYLKDPPKGYTLPGVDIFGGLDEIKSNLQGGVYTNQWSFEKDLWSLINILPHDFHLNLPLPLVDVFSFGTFRSLVSVSDDGLTVPKVYLKKDWDAYASGNPGSVSLPSALVKINGEDTNSFLERLSLTMSPFQDADAVYNQLFYSPPNNLQAQANLFRFGAWMFGFSSDTFTYQFANGSTAVYDNLASPNIDFSGITDGPSLFRAVEVQLNGDVTTLLSRRDLLVEEPLERRQSSSGDMVGYPTPYVVHSEGAYTAGFFMTTEVAVLTMSAFASTNPNSTTDQAEMQAVIAKFLSQCKIIGSTYLIVDLSANGGGSVFSGYDAFKQLFPTIVPYGGSRMRTTPFVDYLGNVFSSAGVYNKTVSPEWQIQSALDKDLKKFPTWSDMGGPFRIYGDNFLAITRANLSDPIMTSGFSVSGYLNKPTIPAQVFDPKNIVVLYDGGCGSTCAIFAEFMKTQAGVRSIAVGGRAQTGPMQGVGGSKGAQVLKYLNIEVYRDALKIALAVLSQKKKPIPATGPASFIPPDIFTDAPLGSKATLLKRGRINLRSAIRADDTSQTPLQFVYEPANCRLFYTIDDVYDQSFLWERAFNATWGGAKCVDGSTINTGDTMPTKATDTVAYDSKVNTAVVLPDQPGLVRIGSTPGTGAGSGVDAFGAAVSGTGTGTSTGSGSSSTGTAGKKSAGRRVGPSLGSIEVACTLIMAALWLL